MAFLEEETGYMIQGLLTSARSLVTVAAEQQLNWGTVSEVKHGAPVLQK